MNKVHTPSIGELQTAIESGAISGVEFCECLLRRAETLDGTYNAIIEHNPEALERAGALERERRAGRAHGPLHGMPVMVKDNLDSADQMQTSAGSLALTGTPARADSTVLARLRAAGAVLLAKTNLSEWANFRSTRSSSGWSSRGGQTRNAHDPARTPGGSSSGSAVAVALGYCVAAIGTETDGLIVGPAAMNGIVGIKPTVGLVSRAGIVPIAWSQDTAGPMTRGVRDGALVLDAIMGADTRDPLTQAHQGRGAPIAARLDAGALHGARLGVARDYAGFHDRVDRVFDSVLDALRAAGAQVIDPIALPAAETIRPQERFVMEWEFKRGLNRYLAERIAAGSAVPVGTLGELIAFNEKNAAQLMPHFAQEILLAAQAHDDIREAEYHRAREACLRLAGEQGIDAALAKHRLDAIIAPTHTPAWMIDWVGGDNRRGSSSILPAVTGYPHVTVPMGFVEHLPVGLSFMAGAYQDFEVINLAYAFEQHTQAWRAPNTAID